MSLSKEIIKFNSHTSARDKWIRLLQYGSRLVLWQLTYGSPTVQSEVITRLRKLEAALGLSRKLFRLGNSMDLFHKAWDSLAVPQRSLRLLAVLSHTTKALWLLMDHILWAGKVGLVKADLPYWTKWSLRAWLVALVSATVADLIKLEATHCAVDRHRKENGKTAALPAPLQVEMRSVRLNFWRDFCDLFIPLSGLGYASPGIGALGGTISSMIGFQQEWERHVRPFKVTS